ncbi:EF-hand calcium-binding domain-containing protein 11-like isoform X6 [Balaenoptera acutorostrata]|uniref:EF-hand calcium-binding domain-containing protein 11-like isoform X1 n=1 Tax=Balaenoptera acutorostrata TaxID=9767 RepID=A0ABM3T9F4_BALAC|nr:EF-hand calcium-binding domain-containing protein 11-like isoform X1 [Balaenoptera acutorostrata]XP_057398722.1 EF-hand calcium-binding domain-containing protein 11-like isoform X6 [Balaenoptera acutorostrata]
MFFSQAGARPRMWEASPSEYKKWVEVFKACDEENKGCLSRENFKVAVVMLFGYKPSKIEADAVMSSVDPNTSGILLKEFLDIVRKKKEAQLYRNEIRHIFTAFDRHYRGYLTLEDFKKAFKQVAPKLSERIILEVFRALKTRNCSRKIAGGAYPGGCLRLAAPGRGPQSPVIAPLQKHLLLPPPSATPSQLSFPPCS